MMGLEVAFFPCHTKYFLPLKCTDSLNKKVLLMIMKIFNAMEMCIKEKVKNRFIQYDHKYVCVCVCIVFKSFYFICYL